MTFSRLAAPGEVLAQEPAEVLAQGSEHHHVLLARAKAGADAHRGDSGRLYDTLDGVADPAAHGAIFPGGCDSAIGPTSCSAHLRAFCARFLAERRP